MKKSNSSNKAGYGLNDHRTRSIIVAVLLVFAVLLSASSGVYAGASFLPQDVTVTTTVYSTTTSWTTSTIWSTVTQVVQGVLTTVAYTTSTSTVTVTSSSTATSPAIVGTSITITVVTGTSGGVKSGGGVTVKGILKDAGGNRLQGLQLTVTVDGGYTGRVITGSGGNFVYAGPGPKTKGTHTVTVWFIKTTQYAASSANRSYSL